MKHRAWWTSDRSGVPRSHHMRDCAVSRANASRRVALPSRKRNRNSRDVTCFVSLSHFQAQDGPDADSEGIVWRTSHWRCVKRPASPQPTKFKGIAGPVSSATASNAETFRLMPCRSSIAASSLHFSGSRSPGERNGNERKSERPVGTSWAGATTATYAS